MIKTVTQKVINRNHAGTVALYGKNYEKSLVRMVTRELRVVRTGFLQKFLRHILKFIKTNFSASNGVGGTGNGASTEK